jgi:antitoxin VapB
MATAKVFRLGNGQALRLPKEFRFTGKAVEIFRRGDEIILREKRKGMARAFELLAGLPQDFDLSNLGCDAPQRRKSL